MANSVDWRHRVGCADASPDELLPGRKPVKTLTSTFVAILLAAICLALASAAGGYFWLDQAQPAPPAHSRPLTLAIVNAPISGLGLLAFAKRFFERERLDVTLQFHTTGKACLNAALNADADLATVADTPIMHAGWRGDKIYTIATIERAQKNTGIVARADRGISHPNDLAGKKIGVTIGTSGEFLLDTFLTFHRMGRQAIQTINLKPEEMVDALATGDVDAVTTWHPYLSRSQRVLGDGAITFYAEGMYTETFNLVAMQDFVNKHPATIKRVLRALARAEEFMKGHPAESRNIIARQTGIDRALLTELWPVFDFTLTLDQSLLVTLESEARWVRTKTGSDRTLIPNYLDIIYLDGLQAVKPEAVTIIR